MKLTRPVLFLALALACLGATGAAALDEGERLQFADGLFLRGIYDMALKEYMVFLESYPESVSADAVWYRTGECYRELGNRIAAERAYVRAVGMAESPYRFRAWLRRAELQMDGGRWEPALAMLDELLTQGPPGEIAAAALYQSGFCLERLDRKGEAAGRFEQVLAAHKDSPFHAYALLALGNLRAADPASAPGAEEMYLNVTRQPPSPRLAAEAWFRLGALYYERRDYARSAHAYQQLLEGHAEDARADEARLQAAWAFHHAGRYADAMALCEAGRAREDLPAAQQAAWLYVAANSERNLMRHEAAAKSYALLIERYADSPYAAAAAYERALSLYKLGRYEEAVAQARAIKPGPELTEKVYWLLAESHAALKNPDQAIQSYRLIVTQFPESELAPEALFRLAHLLRGREEFAAAADLYGQVFRKHPAAPVAAQALFSAGYCLARAGREEEAVREWAQLVQSYPDDPLVEDALYQRAMADTHLGRKEQALESFAELHKRYPASRFGTEARYWSGLIHESAERLGDAEADLRAALAGQPGQELKRRAQLRLAIVLYKRERRDEAAALLQELLETPARGELIAPLLEWLAEHRLARGEFEAALAAGGALVENAGTEAEWKQIGRYIEGRSLIGLGRDGEAQARFAESVAIPARTPALAQAHLGLGRLALAAGDFAAAGLEFGKAADLATDDAALPVRVAAYVGLGKAFEGQGDFDAAARFFMSVALLFDDPAVVPESLYRAAVAFQRLGRTEEAARTVGELKARYPESEWAGKALPEAAEPEGRQEP